MKSSGNMLFFLARWQTALNHPDRYESFILWNATKRHIFAIDAPAHPDIDFTDRIESDLERIHGCLKSLHLDGPETQGYLVESRSGPRIIQKPLRHRGIDYSPLWALCVDIRELEILSVHLNICFVVASVNWKGKNASLHFGYDEESFRALGRFMAGYTLVKDLDVTFEIIAHVFHGENLVGYLTESVKSCRILAEGDRAAVYKAISCLERNFIVYTCVSETVNIVVNTDGKVRFKHLGFFQAYPKSGGAAFEQACQQYHWDVLPRMFSEMKTTMLPHMRRDYDTRLLYAWSEAPVWLSDIPAPTKVLARYLTASPESRARPAVVTSTRTRPQATERRAGFTTSSRGKSSTKDKEVDSRDPSYDPPPPYTRYATKLLIFDDVRSREDSTASIIEL